LSKSAVSVCLLCMEEGSISRTLAFSCGHGYAQGEYAMKRESGGE